MLVEGKRYRDLPSFFKTLFGERVQKLSIDGGFTCPNRDGNKGWGGCTYCNNASFNPDYCREVEGITRQLEEGIRFFDAKYQGHFGLYCRTFQALLCLYGIRGGIGKREGFGDDTPSAFL